MCFKFYLNSPDDVGETSHPVSAAAGSVSDSSAAAAVNPSPTNEALTPQSPLLESLATDCVNAGNKPCLSWQNLMIT